MNAALANATRGAGLTFHDVHDAGPPRDPLPETHPPVIFRGETGTEAMVEPYDGGPPSPEILFLAKSDNPEQAYKLIGKPSKHLDHHGAGWGSIHYAVTLPRRRRNNETVLTFRAPDPSEARLVAIKQLDKAVVGSYLRRGGHEDPYKEISRMQRLGDGFHVLQCLEALEDDKCIYSVMPYCNEGSLMDNLPWTMSGGTGYPEDEAKALFINILEILVYLERHGIFHHDLAPDNFLFFNGRLVLFDFAMSLPFPREDDGTRYLMRPQGVYGTMPCMAPELYFNGTPFDGVAGDLWGAGTILYSLLTGHILYSLPAPADILFRYYILAGGLRPGLNEEMVEILEGAFSPDSNDDQDNLMAHAMANLNIPPDALEVLIGLLNFNPSARWTLKQTIDSAWVQAA
ncbi:MAP/microtubule affinity-regulating kinase 3 [Seminavis robusta]|uniref:MAP/microtubule affinity-regulating kinase 3 n=1 Tax=Seminavis robusta TaxID=568900 RepID=A0A9N8EKQ8_9STRA|nr:MAP/microtubule affinity-regulating kinase 3 [Seminavis robusta]|eukprot:Sro1271_g258050.1 MAP/microtubule affinity-regulating kinase 3 (401) ;mRNA; r:4271-5473